MRKIYLELSKPRLVSSFVNSTQLNLTKTSKVLCIVTWYGKYTRALTFENLTELGHRRLKIWLCWCTDFFWEFISSCNDFTTWKLHKDTFFDFWEFDGQWLWGCRGIRVYCPPPGCPALEDYDPPWGLWDRHTFSKVLYMDTLHLKCPHRPWFLRIILCVMWAIL